MAPSWYDSPDYAKALAVRDSVLRCRLLFVDELAAEVEHSDGDDEPWLTRGRRRIQIRSERPFEMRRS